MAMNVFTCFSIALVATSIQTGRNLAIHIEINPETYYSFTHHAVDFSCTTDDKDRSAKKIMLVELYKDTKPIVVLHQGKQPQISNENHTHLVAVGHIDPNVRQSSLKVTMVNPQTDDFGDYACVIYYVNDIGILREQTDRKSLTEGEFNMDTVKKGLNYLKNKMLTLEEKADYTSAFSATNRKDIPTTFGQIAILPDVIMRMGKGYDETTGVFTAPRDGVYVFHLVVTDDKKGCGLDMDLMANKKVLARLYTIDATYAQQSSISSVVNLKAGDEVYSIMKDSHCGLQDRLYTMFTGYLIKAF